MAKTEDEKRDAYYRRKYGVGLDWYNARLVEQDHKCGICCRPQEHFSKRLAIDHDHAWKKVKIRQPYKIPATHEWFADAIYLGRIFKSMQANKRIAVRAVKDLVRAASCRGLLCPFCNRGLKYYADNTNRLANAAEYLKRHQICLKNT